MKSIFCCLLCTSVACSVFSQNNGKQDVFQKANNTANKVSTVIAVFQPYLLKAREIYYDAKQLASDAKAAAKNGNANNNANSNANSNANNGANNNTNNNANNNANNTANNGANNNANNNIVYSSNDPNQGNGQGSNNGNNNNGNGNNNIQNYLPNQSLPVNNPAVINNDGTGNWGNQNNGLYGNCLDALTGTVLGMGEAADKPTSVDLMFFAPADGQNTFYIMTPGFARNNGTATYMTEHTSDQVKQWTDVNETEVALTKLTLGQFQQIQNNGQIQSAVRNAQNYSGYYSSVEQKLDGQVLAVKAQMENRTVYALVAIVKQIGNSGSNGYLKIMIKAQGIDNSNGQLNANAYLR